jgi:cytochrome c-type biogenesis protein CcmH/NrfF
MRRTLVAVLAALAVAPGAALAAEPRASLPDIEDEVMCVTCNVPLNIAESPQAARQREYIRRLIEQGQTKSQIKASLVAEYGEDVLGLPEDRGVGIAAYAVPIVFVAILLAALAIIAPRWRRRTPEPAVAGAPPSATDAELQRLDQDLHRLD